MKRPAITQAMKLEVYTREGLAPCYVCGSIGFISGMQLDHQLSLVDGGEHSASNLSLICVPCHRIKSGKEHVGNAKAKRLKKAREAHEAILRGEPKPPGTIKSRGFQGHRKFDGTAVWRKS